jgi:hypothetical protein
MNKTLDQSKINQALDLLLEKGADLSKALEKSGLIKQLSKAIFERALSAEMEEYLGYSRTAAVMQIMLAMAVNN